MRCATSLLLRLWGRLRTVPEYRRDLAAIRPPRHLVDDLFDDTVEVGVTQVMSDSVSLLRVHQTCDPDATLLKFLHNVVLGARTVMLRELLRAPLSGLVGQRFGDGHEHQ